MKPRVFIGSSVEGKGLAEAIQANLDHDAYCTVWSQGVFGTGSNSIDALLDGVRTNDFGVFVLSPDDVTVIRADEFRVARDNVLLEAGMFLGRYGKEKAFLVTPRGLKDYHIPSDLLGITPADYDPTRLRTDKAQATLGSACTKIKEAIAKVPNHANELIFQANLLVGPSSGSGAWTFPAKLSIDITNNSGCEVVLKPVFFKYGLALKRAPNARAMGNPADGKFPFSFRGPSGIHNRGSVLLVKGDSTNTYAAIDQAMSNADVQNAIAKKQVGELHLNCYWMDENPRVQYHVACI
jgi:hypothetical protein